MKSESLLRKSEPPAYVLLCLDPNCHGEFYLPLDAGEAQVCPNDRDHPIALYVFQVRTMPQRDLQQTTTPPSLETWGPVSGPKNA